MTSSAATAASRPGTTNPGRPVVSATNITAASGTRYPAPRNAATPITTKSVVLPPPTTPTATRPSSAPATTRGTNSPPTPPPATVTAVARQRTSSTTATNPRARSGGGAKSMGGYRTPIARGSSVSDHVIANNAAIVTPAPRIRYAGATRVT